MKIGILVREETMENCTGKGCLNAFNQRKDSFSTYDKDTELITFTHSGGNLERKINRMLENGIEVVHISSCIRAKSMDYEVLANRLSEHFSVVGYTHGSEEGNVRKTIFIKLNRDK